MNEIVFPLKLQMEGVEVGDLHQALIALGFEIAAKERKEQYFDPVTGTSVLAFQEKHGLEPTGAADQKTATRMNREPEGRERQTAGLFSIRGRVMTADDPLAGGACR